MPDPRDEGGIQAGQPCGQRGGQRGGIFLGLAKSRCAFGDVEVNNCPLAPEVSSPSAIGTRHSRYDGTSGLPLHHFSNLETGLPLPSGSSVEDTGGMMWSVFHMSKNISAGDLQDTVWPGVGLTDDVADRLIFQPQTDLFNDLNRPGETSERYYRPPCSPSNSPSKTPEH